MTSIGESAFSNCKGLTTLAVPSGVTSIESGTFGSCVGLTSITLPEGLTSIGQYAFDNCTGLTSLTIPGAVTRIGYSAFSGCSSLTAVTCTPTTPPTGGSNMFYNTNDCPIYVPSASVDAYQSAQYWSAYAARIQAML